MKPLFFGLAFVNLLLFCQLAWAESSSDLPKRPIIIISKGTEAGSSKFLGLGALLKACRNGYGSPSEGAIPPMSKFNWKGPQTSKKEWRSIFPYLKPVLETNSELSLTVARFDDIRKHFSKFNTINPETTVLETLKEGIRLKTVMGKSFDELQSIVSLGGNEIESEIVSRFAEPKTEILIAGLTSNSHEPIYLIPLEERPVESLMKEIPSLIEEITLQASAASMRISRIVILMRVNASAILIGKDLLVAPGVYKASELAAFRRAADENPEIVLEVGRLAGAYLHLWNSSLKPQNP